MFLGAYLTKLQQAIVDGVSVKGYFQWSAKDNFKWINGYGDRFGLVSVDFHRVQQPGSVTADGDAAERATDPSARGSTQYFLGIACSSGAIGLPPSK
jgi:beta-glucosidase/6-phospho-beta-glucosidase/beta-galactosidase